MKNKTFLYFIGLTISLLYACHSGEEQTLPASVEELTVSEKERQYQEGNAFIQSTDFEAKFLMPSSTKTWAEVYAFYKEIKAHRKESPYFDQFQHLVLLNTFVPNPKAPCQSCIFNGEDSPEARLMLEEYASDFVVMKSRDPRIAFHLLKHLQKHKDVKTVHDYAQACLAVAQPVTEQVQARLRVLQNKQRIQSEWEEREKEHLKAFMAAVEELNKF